MPKYIGIANNLADMKSLNFITDSNCVLFSGEKGWFNKVRHMPMPFRVFQVNFIKISNEQDLSVKFKPEELYVLVSSIKIPSNWSCPKNVYLVNIKENIRYRVSVRSIKGKTEIINISSHEVRSVVAAPNIIIAEPNIIVTPPKAAPAAPRPEGVTIAPEELKAPSNPK